MTTVAPVTLDTARAVARLVELDADMDRIRRGVRPLHTEPTTRDIDEAITRVAGRFAYHIARQYPLGHRSKVTPARVRDMFAVTGCDYPAVADRYARRIARIIRSDYSDGRAVVTSR